MDTAPPPAIVQESGWLARAEALSRELDSVYVSKNELKGLGINCFGPVPQKPEKENKGPID